MLVAHVCRSSPSPSFLSPFFNQKAPAPEWSSHSSPPSSLLPPSGLHTRPTGSKLPACHPHPPKPWGPLFPCAGRACCPASADRPHPPCLAAAPAPGAPTKNLPSRQMGFCKAWEPTTCLPHGPGGLHAAPAPFSALCAQLPPCPSSVGPGTWSGWKLWVEAGTGAPVLGALVCLLVQPQVLTAPRGPGLPACVRPGVR